MNVVANVKIARGTFEEWTIFYNSYETERHKFIKDEQIEKVCAEQAEPAEKVRSGHLPAAGALIGAVMKETKGQADAARVRELLLAHLGQA